MIETIAYCGLDCSQCPSYQATKKNDIAALESQNLAELMQKIPRIAERLDAIRRSRAHSQGLT